MKGVPTNLRTHSSFWRPGGRGEAAMFGWLVPLPARRRGGWCDAENNPAGFLARRAAA